jgi:anti-anti-sigma factor
MAWHDLEVERAAGKEPGTTIYRLKGSFTDCEVSYRILESVREAAKAGPTTVVLNLSGSNHITSGGIGVIAACYSSLVEKDGRLILVGVHSRYEALFNVVGLWERLEHYATEEEAGLV